MLKIFFCQTNRVFNLVRGVSSQSYLLPSFILTHYCLVKPHCSTFRIITAIFFVGVAGGVGGLIFSSPELKAHKVSL